MLPIRFQLKLFCWLVLAFMLFTVAGTLSHELGHIAVAQMLGMDTHLGYGYMNTDKPWNLIPAQHRLLILIGGPLQTVLTGTTGLLLLFLYRRKFDREIKLLPGQWLFVFLTLFWLRQSANLLMGSVSRSGRDDESRIAAYLGLPSSSIGMATGIAGLLILAVVVFRFIPRQQRLTFLAAGLAGGVAGFWLWLIKLGPVLMP